NELRIGNWYEDAFIGYTQVRGEDLADWEAVNSLPIRLNPEVFAKCGFENKPIFEGFENGVFTKNGLKIGLHMDDFVKDQYTIIFAEEDIMVKVRYLHQLQNLYYALTGEELVVSDL